MPGHTPQSKASEAAREFNEAARWGRMDVALQRAGDPSQFQKDRASWHHKIRIVDTELAGLNLTAPTEATVQVDVHWLLDDDTNLRVTRLEQEWSDEEGKWVMLKEERIGGAEGLFGEDVERAEPRDDRHFPTRVIR